MFDFIIYGRGYVRTFFIYCHLFLWYYSFAIRKFATACISRLSLVNKCVFYLSIVTLREKFMTFVPFFRIIRSNIFVEMKKNFSNVNLTTSAKWTKFTVERF